MKGELFPLMKLRSYRSARYRGATVLYRAAYDITLAKRGRAWVVPDDTRLRETLPSLRWLIARARNVVILSWLGRPKQARQPAFRMDPVGRRLGTLLRRPVLKLDDCVGPEVERAIRSAKPGSVILLENVRFHEEEERNDPKFAQAITKPVDLMINDAFAQCHRRVASIVGLPKYLDAYAGPLLLREVVQLSRVVENPRRPLVAILGGGKISSEQGIGGQRVPTKLRLIGAFLRQADFLLLGGAIANMLLAAQGINVGHSLVDSTLERVVRKFKVTNPKLKLPIDVVTAHDASGRGFARRAIGNVRSNEFIYDIGPDTVALYSAIIRTARTVVWNGPLGLVENPRFAYGTNAIAARIASSRAFSIVGGGDTISAVHRTRKLNQMSYVSTAGGAMLEFLERGTLPGLEPLRIR